MSLFSAAILFHMLRAVHAVHIRTTLRCCFFPSVATYVIWSSYQCAEMQVIKNMLYTDVNCSSSRPTPARLRCFPAQPALRFFQARQTYGPFAAAAAALQEEVYQYAAALRKERRHDTTATQRRFRSGRTTYVNCSSYHVRLCAAVHINALLPSRPPVDQVRPHS